MQRLLFLGAILPAIDAVKKPDAPLFLGLDKPDIDAVKVMAAPFPMSQVNLTGDWAKAQLRNQEVLLSLNMTRWGCHFTTTANITSCQADVAVWSTYIKQPNTTDKYTHKLGFLVAGDDVRPPQNVSFQACESFCSSTATCLAFTFKGPASASTLKCYWKTRVRFTPNRGSNCVAAGGVGMPACSPLPGEMGLGGYYGHYQGHWLSATSFLINNTGNERLRAVAEAAVATLARVMEEWKAKYHIDGYLFPYDPLVFDKLLSGHGAGPYYSVPFYTMHKLMAGLLDQYDFARNEQAYGMVQRMARWVHGRVEACIAQGGMALWQRVLGTEWGGMNDVLYKLYQRTGDPMHLATARRFNGYVFTAPLAAGQDDLSKLPFPHANFHLPEIVGNVRAFELTGNATDKKVTDTFFAALTTNHSYATGGSNSGECWQNPRDLGNFLTDQTEESCTQYNVLKVARRMFLVSAEPALADFYERAIWNGIIGNQNREDPSGATSYIYMQPLGGANMKPWGKSDFGFPCCWGTLSESFAKLTDSIFFQQPGGSGLYVNQFVSASVRTDHYSVEQVAHFPSHPTKTATITVHPTQAQHTFALYVRVPGWATGSNRVTVNGQSVALDCDSGCYTTIERTWKDGDVVELSFPPSLWTNPLNDFHPEHNATLAFMYGPLVLAGVHLHSDIMVPGGADIKRNPQSFIRRNSSEVVEFEATTRNGTKFKMIPLKDVMLERYVVYFMTAGTKPPQPPVHYCPHSAGTVARPHHDEGDADLVSAGPPSPSPHSFTLVSRGVTWSLRNGDMSSH